MELNLFQKDVAEIFEVSEDSITFWENDRTMPQIQFYPAIITFLGFNPFIVDTSTLGGKIKQFRHENGLSHKEFGKLVYVNASSVGCWESGEFKPHPETAKEIEKLLNTSQV